jgi:threonylcarbamoyladenosine tRNA methylthiotransferase CDKAL1
MPGARVYIETYGCSLNIADSEVMAGLLGASGYVIVSSPAEADAIILNSCTVKEKTFRTFVQRLSELDTLSRNTLGSAPHPKIIVTGCIPKPYASTPLLENHCFLGVDAMGDIASVVERALRGERVQSLDGTPLPRLNVPKLRTQKVIEIIPIAQGCVGNCAYCQTRIARGSLRSYPVEEILSHVRCALRGGIKEIWLTAQDTGAYGRDIETDVVQLLRALISLPGDFQIRLGMTNPNFALEHLDGLLSVFQSPKLFRFLHIPLQAGSDRVLRAMNRAYTARDFLTICEAFRSEFDRFSIATDVICGFPGETDDDFASTLRILEEVKPAVVNRSRFCARPFTPAAEMTPLPQQVVAERSRRLARLVEHLSYEDNQTWLRWQGSVLVDQQKKTHNLLGRNCAYKPIVIDRESPTNTADSGTRKSITLGDRVDVRIIGATTFHLIGCAEMPDASQ